MNELKPGQRILPSFHLTCFGCAHSNDMRYDSQFGCVVTKCKKQPDKFIPVVHPTIDCKQFIGDSNDGNNKKI